VVRILTVGGRLTSHVCVTLLSFVMPGLVPGIHVFEKKQGVDGRDKPGHDEF
jgi:hypothetical protein